MTRTLLALLCLTLSSAFASTMSFTDRASWQAATSARGLRTANPFSLGSLVMAGDSRVVTGIAGRSGNTITPLGDTQLVVADQDAPGYDFGIPQVISAQLGFPSTLLFSFGAGTFGFGFDAGAFPVMGDMTDLALDIITSDGLETFRFFNLGGMSTSFVGFTSSKAILSMTVSGGPADPAFGNISVASVPEPGTAALVLFAGGALLGWRRRR